MWKDSLFFWDCIEIFLNPDLMTALSLHSLHIFQLLVCLLFFVATVKSRYIMQDRRDKWSYSVLANSHAFASTGPLSEGWVYANGAVLGLRFLVPMLNFSASEALRYLPYICVKCHAWFDREFVFVVCLCSKLNVCSFLSIMSSFWATPLRESYCCNLLVIGHLLDWLCGY